MTTFDRFDPFERRIGEALEGIAPPRPLDYLDDVFRQTARTAQRPRWSFPERWFNVDTTLARPILFGRRVPIRSIVLLAVVATLLATLAFYVGTQRRLPAPFGPAANGQLVFGMNGDLYALDSLTAAPRLLRIAPGDQQGVIVSPDGLLIGYDNYDGVAKGGDPYEWVANIDGSNPRQVLDRPYTFETFEWAPDSRSIAIITRPDGRVPELWIAPADGSGARQLVFDSFVAWGATWDPTRSGVLLVRGADRKTLLTDLYYVTTEGEVLESFGMQPRNLNGPPYELSGITFSPDGQTIAYNSIEAIEAPVNRFRAHVMHRDGSNDRAIPAPLATNYSQAWPAFSPDGTSLLLSSWETTSDGRVVHRLAIAPADGSAPARRLELVLDSENQVKSWSPDGSRILLCACDRNKVYSIDPVSGASEQLPWAADAPGWQRLAP
jgi:Tol biopolymer transport system component